MAHPRTVLFVCTGNQCRSAAAEAILRKMAEEAALDVVIESAGTITCLRGCPAQPATIQAASERGYDLGHHTSQAVTRALLQRSDLVLAMAHEHVQRLIRAHPHETSRVHLFKPYCLGQVAAGPEMDDIPDPVGEPIAVHRDCVSEISRCLEQLIARWKHETSSSGAGGATESAPS